MLDVNSGQHKQTFGEEHQRQLARYEENLAKHRLGDQQVEMYNEDGTIATNSKGKRRYSHEGEYISTENGTRRVLTHTREKEEMDKEVKRRLSKGQN